MPKTERKLRAIIVDNEPNCVREIEELLSAEDRIEVIAALSNPEEAIIIIKESNPDILFLDIDMPGMNGFELLNNLRESDVITNVVFVTGFRDFAIEAIKHRAFDYLLKPLDPLELKATISRLAIEIFENKAHTDFEKILDLLKPATRIKLRTTGGFALIDLADIIYIEADWNYCIIHLSNNKKEMVTFNLGTVEKLLPSDMFIRISRSNIINITFLKRVKRLTRQCILCKDEKEFKLPIPLGRIKVLESLL